MSTVNNMQIQDDEGNVFHPETSIEQIVGENGTQVFPGGKPGNMESSDMTTAFTESKMRENIKSGEKHRVLFGKIQKFFTDLKTVAFSGKYGDLSERPTLGGAAGYKVADNDTTNSSEFLSTARVAYEHGKEIDALSSDLGGLSFCQDADGNWGYKIGGADPVVPFKSSKVAMGGFKFLGNNGNPNGSTVDVGFKPDFIMYGFLGGSDITKAFYNGGSGNDRTMVLWWAELQKEFIWDSASSNPPKCIRRSFPTGPSTGNRLALQEVTDTGFKVYGGYGSGAAFYVCIKLE